MLRLPGKKFFKRYLIFAIIFYIGIPLLLVLWFGIVAREGVMLADVLRASDRVAVYNYNESLGNKLISSYRRPEPMYYFMLYTMATANKYGEG